MLSKLEVYQEVQKHLTEQNTDAAIGAAAALLRSRLPSLPVAIVAQVADAVMPELVDYLVWNALGRPIPVIEPPPPPEPPPLPEG